MKARGVQLPGIISDLSAKVKAGNWETRMRAQQKLTVAKSHSPTNNCESFKSPQKSGILVEFPNSPL